MIQSSQIMIKVKGLSKMTLNIASPIDIDSLSQFLEEMNNNPKTHIGYCGESKSEIYHTLLNDFSDLDLSESFAVAYDNDEIIGALGFDIDVETKSVEVWGPFIKDEGKFESLANDLWEKMNLITPLDIKSYSFFVNNENMLTRQFVQNLGGMENDHHLILKAHRNNTRSVESYGIIKYESSYLESFITLHAAAFPHTYYGADEILQRINKENQLLIMKDTDEKMKGYVYVEADPENQEGAIEYIAVSSDYRKQGIGTKLMRVALDHLFSYDEITEVTLCVALVNEKAVHLYKSAGFHVKHELISFKM